MDGKNWNSEKTFSWHSQIGLLVKEGFSADYIMQIKYLTDPNRSYVVALDQPKLGMSYADLRKGFASEKVKAYYRYMVDAAMLLGATNHQKAEAELKESLQLEIELAKMAAPKEERRNETKFQIGANLTKINEILGHYGNLNWTTFINFILAETGSSTNVGCNETILLQDIPYIVNVTKLLNETHPRVIGNYLGWRPVMASMNVLNKAARELRLKFLKDVHNIQALPPHWRSCLFNLGFNSDSYTKLGVAVGSLYVRNYFNAEKKKKILEVTSYMEKAFKKHFNNLSWMDSATLQKAKEKLGNITKCIAFPKELTNRTLVEELHKGDSISCFSFY